jgi:hypothetical protein
VRVIWVGGLVVCGVLSLVAGWAIWLQKHNPRENNYDQVAAALPLDEVSTDEVSLLLPTIVMPPVLSGEAARSVDQRASVIGVSIAGHHRAYLISAFEDPCAAVVDDMLGPIPVTVAHHAGREKTRVFSDQPNGFPIEMAADCRGGSLRLSLHGKFYDFDARTIPLEERRFTVTTWGAWQQQHPESDIYVGVPRERGGDASQTLASGLNEGLARNNL